MSIKFRHCLGFILFFQVYLATIVYTKSCPVIDFNYKNYQDLMLVPVTIAQKNYPIIVDSGSQDGINLLRRVLLAHHSKPLPLKSKQSMDLRKTVYRTEYYKIHTLKLGNCLFSNLKVKTFPEKFGILKKSFKKTDRYGNLGWAILGKYNITILRKEHRIILTRSLNPPMHYLAKIKFTHTAEGIISSVRIGQQKITVLWDTGTNISMIKPHVLNSTITHCPKARTLGKHCQMQSFPIMASLRSLHAYLMPLAFSADSLVGSDFLNHYDVYIDNQHQIIYFMQA